MLQFVTLLSILQEENIFICFSGMELGRKRREQKGNIIREEYKERCNWKRQKQDEEGIEIERSREWHKEIEKERKSETRDISTDRDIEENCKERKQR